jgi:glycosyltransferase involved in cell wall biosynthesis
MKQSHQIDSPLLSLIIPARDEEDNLRPLVAEIENTLFAALGKKFEVLFIDDGSTDQTLEILKELASNREWMRVFHLKHGMGQSAGLYAGIMSARGKWLATLDADLQNDPSDILKMLSIAEDSKIDMVQGDRSKNRKDNFIRKIGSRIGKNARRLIIGDSTTDTGCSARLLRSQFAKVIPLQFIGMHRFFPAIARMNGATIIEMPVHHRSRYAGKTKYGMGIFNRALPGLLDCLAVRWMNSRFLPVSISFREIFDERNNN